MTLVLGSDPTKTKVKAEWADGTITEARIYWSDGRSVHGWYAERCTAKGCTAGCGCTFSRDIESLGIFPNGTGPKLINAPEEFEEVPVTGFLRVQEDGTIGQTFYREKDDAEKFSGNKCYDSIELRGTRKVKKPKPPEPVVLEGYAVFQAADTYEFRTVKCRNSTPATLTIKPEGK